MRNLLLVLAVLFQSFHLMSEDAFKVQITLSKNQVAIDEILGVELLLTYPKNYSPDFQLLRRNITRNSDFYGPTLFLKSMNVEDAVVLEKDPNMIQSKILLKMQPLREGDALFTLYKVEFEEESTKNRQSITSKLLPITITSNENNIDFQPSLASLMTFSKSYPLQLNFENQNKTGSTDYFEKLRREDIEQMAVKKLPWVEMLTVCLIGFILWLFLKNPNQKEEMTQERKNAIAKAKALKTIEKIKQKNLLDDQNPDAYYTDLTKPIREYMETKYSIPISVTSREFLQNINQYQELSSEKKQQLQKFFATADKVKFSHYQPSIDERKQSEVLVDQFIES